MNTKEKHDGLSHEVLTAIVIQAKAGDRDALSQLITIYYPKIYRYVYYRLDNPEDAKDLINDIFVKVMQAIRNQNGSFKAWIYRIAANAVTDFYRYRSVRNNVTHDVSLRTYAADDEPIDDKLFKGHDLRRAIQKLTEDQQQVIILRFVEGYPSQEIAHIMEKSAEAVRGIQFRALNALRKILGDQE